MFDVAPTEILILGIVAIAVIPPKDLPRAMRFAGKWFGKVRGIARQFRSGFDEIIRESEIQEMEKKWRAENARIMAQHSPGQKMLDYPPDDDADVPDSRAPAAMTAPPPPDQVSPPASTPAPAMRPIPDLPPLDRSS